MLVDPGPRIGSLELVPLQGCRAMRSQSGMARKWKSSVVWLVGWLVKKTVI